MAVSESTRQSIIPSFLYSNKSLNFNNIHSHSRNPISSSPQTPSSAQKNFMIPSPNEPLGKIEMYSPSFYVACTAGGVLSCGLTHMTVTPLDLVKCNMQV
ncbi:hypothetical protein ACHQM5_026038 [Ranunculus cassubicifolius]